MQYITPVLLLLLQASLSLISSRTNATLRSRCTMCLWWQYWTADTIYTWMHWTVSI